jgi:hypothetical protein
MTTLTQVPRTLFKSPTTAAAPAEARGLARDQVRLLVGTRDGIRHVRFRDLPDQLRAGDLLVVNNSATVTGQLDAIGTRWARFSGPPVVPSAPCSRSSEMTRRRRREYADM